MRASVLLFWFVWFMSLLFLLVSAFSYEMSVIIPLLLLFFLTAITMYSQTSYKRRFRRLALMVKNIDFKPLEKELTRIGNVAKEWDSRVSGLEEKLNGFEKYKMEQEQKYRDLVRKFLEVDNKLNKKYKLLGETIIKLSKEGKKG